MKVTVIGAGYVGLVTSAGFARFGHNVTCVDNDTDKIAKLQRHQIPIFEPGLEDLVRDAARWLLRFTNQIPGDADVFVIAVGTPSLSDGSANLKYVVEAAREIGRVIRDGAIVVTKSTVPVGTARLVEQTVREAAGDLVKFEIASNPEFLREGTAVTDFLFPDRVVLGVRTEATFDRLRDLYPTVPPKLIIRTNIASAELAKYACNAMLATRISFMNEMANLAEYVDADILEVQRVMATDDRIGARFLNAGVGYGGSCFPKDVRELHASASRAGVSLSVVGAVHDANEYQKAVLVRKLSKHFNRRRFDGLRVAVWGLAFKPDTDDVREAPALTVINMLVELGAEVVACDPVAIDRARGVLGATSKAIAYVYDPLEATRGADALLLVTEWEVFRLIDLRAVYDVMRKPPVIIDGRNALDDVYARSLGFSYYGIGR